MTDGLPPAATAAHLTDVLRRAGVLGDATVREVTVESARSTIMSRITRAWAMSSWAGKIYRRAARIRGWRMAA